METGALFSTCAKNSLLLTKEVERILLPATTIAAKV
jgi:hypothetical protein